jgi:toxin-antitoxin system PIN domain toxin
VKVVDANVLLYAVNASDPRNAEARAWLDRALHGTETVAFSWLVVIAFVRISTSQLFDDPYTVEEATRAVRRWLDQPAAVMLEPTSRHLDVLRGLLLEIGRAGNLTNDAHLAALAIEHGAEIVSYDRDFQRFGGVTHRLPRVAAGD